MKHIWARTKYELNNKVIFRCQLNGSEDKLLLSASYSYTVYFDDVFVSYGPERTAEGYSRIREIKIPKNTKQIDVIVYDYGVKTYDQDDQQPFFGAEIYENGQLTRDTTYFCAYSSSKYINRSRKYSFQRGFVERFDLRSVKLTKLETYEVKSPIIINGVGDTCDYNVVELNFDGVHSFYGYDEVKMPNYTNPDIDQFDLTSEFFNVINKDHICYEFSLSKEKSGLLMFEIESKEEADIFAIFDEYIVEGKWIFSRSSCSDFINIKLAKGYNKVVCSTVYALKYLRILSKNELKVKVSLICVQNDRTLSVKEGKDEKINAIVDAARNTFMQNAVDLFTDCPGRERSPFLCDSYFTAIAERYFTHKSDIERCFLENYIIGKYSEIPDGMLPMTFPAYSKNGSFIPNWAMWFVIELEEYYKNTKDEELINQAKEKVYGLINFFSKYENEYGLLENLPSWVFIEWSKAGDPEYVECVSFPTNMLYSAMLKSASHLYKDEELMKKSNELVNTINKLSFDGKLFIDNAERKNGVLTPVKEHTSETCQYYALFFDIKNDNAYINFIKDNFGPLRKEQYPEVVRSNSFIGNFLRFFWLDRLGENERIKIECISYFYKMARYSGTLWEKDVPNASCNHGFASSIAVLLTK